MTANQRPIANNNHHSESMLVQQSGNPFQFFRCDLRMGAKFHLQISHVSTPQHFADFSSRLWFPSTWPVQGPVQFHNPLHKFTSAPNMTPQPSWTVCHDPPPPHPPTAGGRG